MAIPNYTYLKLKMPGPKGVITVEGSFEQAYYCKQDYIAQAATLITPCAPDGPSHDAGRVPTKGTTKAVVVPGHPNVGEAAKTSGGNDGLASPSI